MTLAARITTPADALDRIMAVRAAQIASSNPCPPIRYIVHQVAAATGIGVADLLGPSHVRHIAHARQLVMWRAHAEGHSLSSIARALNRDHTTVMYGVRAEKERQQRLGVTP